MTKPAPIVIPPVVKPPKREDILSVPLQPFISITALAAAKINYLVDNCPLEIGWAGAVNYHPDILCYEIVDVWGIKQIGAPAHFTYTSDDYNVAKAALMKNIPEFGGESLGHSHVTMATIPSPDDIEQMMSLHDTASYYIQTIHNKKGDVFGAIYDFTTGYYHDDVYVEIQSMLSAEVIVELEKQLENVTRYVAPPPTSRRFPVVSRPKNSSVITQGEWEEDDYSMLNPEWDSSKYYNDKGHYIGPGATNYGDL